MEQKSKLELNAEENINSRFSCLIHLIEHQKKMENHFVADTYCDVCNEQRNFLFMGGIVNNKRELASMYFMCSHCENIINMKDYHKHRKGN